MSHPPRGKQVVIVLVLLGLTAGAVSVSWWKTQIARARKHHPGQSAPSTLHTQTAQRELERLEQRVQADGQVGRIDSELLDDITAFTRTYPRFSPGFRLLGNVLLLRGDRAGAYEAYLQSLELDPPQAELALNVGTLAFDDGDYERAARHYQQALALEPRSPRYLWHLARAQTALLQYDEARRTLLQALAADSSYDLAYAALADLYKKQNKLSLALTETDKAIEAARRTAPQRVVAHTLAKAQVLRSDNRPDEALLVLQGLGEQDRRRLDVLESLALCWSMRGQYDKSAGLYEEAAALAPLDWRLPAEAARWWLKAGRKDQAQRALDTVRRINPRAPVIGEIERLMR